MAFRGNIETFFFSSLLQLLTNDRKTGVLHIEKEKDEVDIFIKEGSIVNAISSRSKNRLGYLLRTKGIITSENLEKCLSISRGNGQKLGKVLVENNHITTEDLEKFLNDQVEETIYDLFIWEKGNFEFKESELNTDKQVVTNIDTLGIILEASRRVDEISLLKNKGILRPPRFSSSEISKKIGAKYSLAEAQIEQVEQIFEKADQSLGALKHDLEGKKEAAIQQIMAEMKLVLSSEQFEPWKIEFEARHKRHMEKHNPESKNIK